PLLPADVRGSEEPRGTTTPRGSAISVAAQCLGLVYGRSLDLTPLQFSRPPDSADLAPLRGRVYTNLRDLRKPAAPRMATDAATESYSELLMAWAPRPPIRFRRSELPAHYVRREHGTPRYPLERLFALLVRIHGFVDLGRLQ